MLNNSIRNNTSSFRLKPCSQCDKNFSSMNIEDYKINFYCESGHLNLYTLMNLEGRNDKENIDNKLFVCPNHNKKLYSFCFDCNKNICFDCQEEHKEHRRETYFSTSKILKGQISRLQKIFKEYNSILAKLVKEFKSKCDIIAQSFKRFLEVKNNFGFLTKQILDERINFNMNFNNDFENIINEAKKNDIFKTFQSIVQLSDKISNTNPAYNKAKIFFEMTKVENISINKIIEKKDYKIQSLEKVIIKPEKRNEINKSYRQNVAFDKIRDLCCSYEYFKKSISIIIAYQINEEYSINNFYNIIINKLNNLYNQPPIISYLNEIIQEIIIPCPKKLNNKQNDIYNYTSENALIKYTSENRNNYNFNIFNSSEVCEMDEYDLNMGIQDMYGESQEEKKDNNFYEDYDKINTLLDSSINDFEEAPNENQNECKEIKDDQTSIIKKSNSLTDFLIDEEYYNIMECHTIKIRYEEINQSNNSQNYYSDEIEYHKNIIPEKREAYNDFFLSNQKIFFILYSNLFNSSHIVRNINLIYNFFYYIKEPQNKEEISLSSNDENIFEHNRILSENLVKKENSSFQNNEIIKEKNKLINVNNNMVNQIKKSQECINSIIFFMITNHHSGFLNFDYYGIKFHLHLITSRHREKIVYILFLFDNVLLFYFKRDRIVRKSIFPYGYLCKNIFNRYRYKIGKKFLPK